MKTFSKLLGAAIVIFGLAYGTYVWTEYHYEFPDYNSEANANVKNAYTASQAYFTDYPDGTVTLSKLTSYGYVQSSDVSLTIISGNQYNLKITTSHTKGKKTYTIDSAGSISF